MPVSASLLNSCSALSSCRMPRRVASLSGRCVYWFKCNCSANFSIYLIAVFDHSNPAAGFAIRYAKFEAVNLPNLAVCHLVVRCFIIFNTVFIKIGYQLPASGF